jgi:hypothetical protein
MALNTAGIPHLQSHRLFIIDGKVYEALKDNKKRKHMALKITVGEIHKQHGSTPPVATHFYHPRMKKIYGIDLKPHFEQVFAKVLPLRRHSTARQKEIWHQKAWRYRVSRAVNSGFPDKV